MKASLEFLFYCFCFLIVLFSCIGIRYEWNKYMKSERRKCEIAWENANQAHTRFKSTIHLSNWCALHENDWYQKSTQGVQWEHDKINKKSK